MKNIAIRLWPLLACLALVACGADDRSAATGPGQDSGISPPPAPPPPAPPPPPPPPPSDPDPDPPPDPDPVPDNSPPTISGSPPTTAVVGQTWTFLPSISDPDGDELVVTASNIPPWIDLKPSTGRMEGTPEEGDVRTWSFIRVRVSDGEDTASLPWFSIVVSAAGAEIGTATLSWNPPTEREDGSPIGQLAGYRVLYGQTSRDYDTVVTLNNPGINRYMIEGLGPGTWYFAVKAMTSDGLESKPSTEVSKTIS